MSNPPDEKEKASASAGVKEPSRADEGGALSLKEWVETKKPSRREFPGPKAPGIRLRVAFERAAYAEVIAHAKESLDREICGALAGEVCQDDLGAFVEVKAALRGTAARQGSTHVTFTQETWIAIHEKLEKEHPKLGIVGWYHSHPGFGVEFSEMDRFIQRNFFPAPTQIALVTDPLGGDAAICVNTEEGIRNLDRFWVDGREHACKAPRMEAADGGAAMAGGSPGASSEAMRSLEQRMSQLIQACDEQHAMFRSVLYTLFFVLVLGFLTLIGYMIYSAVKSKSEPPKVLSTMPVPIRVDGREVILLLEIKGWQIPPELSVEHHLEQKLRQEFEKRLQQEMERLRVEGNTAPPATR